MRITHLVARIRKNARHQPLLALFVSATLLLGLLHEGQLAGEVAIVVIRKFKHEAVEAAGVGRRLWLELATWQESPASPADEHRSRD